MHQGLGGAAVIRHVNPKEQDLPLLEQMLAQFEHVRHEEIDLLPRFSEEAWAAKRQTTFWGDVSLKWLVDRTMSVWVCKAGC
jgi:hypothetical protein